MLFGFASSCAAKIVLAMGGSSGRSQSSGSRGFGAPLEFQLPLGTLCTVEASTCA